MNEFIKKLIERLETEKAKGRYDHDSVADVKGAYEQAIEIVNQIAEEYEECLNLCSENCEVYDKEKHYCPKWCKVIRETVEELKEEYFKNAMIDGQYCFQTCGATEHCKECNRLGNGSIDYYENYDVLAEEHKDDIQTIDVSELLGEQGNEGWIPCSSGVMPKANGWYLVTNELGVVQQQYWGASHWQKLRDDAVIAWRELPAPYQPKGE